MIQSNHNMITYKIPCVTTYDQNFSLKKEHFLFAQIAAFDRTVISISTRYLNHQIFWPNTKPQAIFSTMPTPSHNHNNTKAHHSPNFSHSTTAALQKFLKSHLVGRSLQKKTNHARPLRSTPSHSLAVYCHSNATRRRDALSFRFLQHYDWAAVRQREASFFTWRCSREWNLR